VFYILRIFTTSTFFLCMLHIQIAWLSLFVVVEVRSTIYPKFLYSVRGRPKERSKINIFIESTSWEYLLFLHFFCCMFHIQIAWYLIFVVVEVQGSIYFRFFYSLRGKKGRVQNKYSHWLFILRILSTSTFFLLHVSHTNCMTFTIYSNWSKKHHLP